MALLEAKNLGISFGGLRAVDDFNIKIERFPVRLIGPTVQVRPPYSTF